MFFQHLFFYDTVYLGCEDLLLLVPLLQRFGHENVELLFTSGALRIAHIQGKPVFGAPGVSSHTPGDFGVVTAYDANRVKKSGLPLDEEVARFRSLSTDLGLHPPSERALTAHGRDLDLHTSPVCDQARSLLASSRVLARWAGCIRDDGTFSMPVVSANTIHPGPYSAEFLVEPRSRCAALLQGVVVRWAASTLGVSDTSTHAIVGEAIRAASHDPNNPSSSSSTLMEVAKLGDIGGFVLDNATRLRDFVKLRESSRASQFRLWFSTECQSQSASEIASAYAEAVSSEHWLSSLPARTIRFMSTTAVGMLPGVPVAAAIAAGAAEAFLLEPLFARRPVKEFLHDLRQLALPTMPQSQNYAGFTLARPTE